MWVKCECNVSLFKMCVGGEIAVYTANEPIVGLGAVRSHLVSDEIYDFAQPLYSPRPPNFHESIRYSKKRMKETGHL